jgi:hypothetical protein
MTTIIEVVYETEVSPNGADIGIPKAALEALGLPSEYEDIQGSSGHANLSVFRTRDRLLYPGRRVYWAHKGEIRHPDEPVRVHLRRAESAT